MNFQGQGQVSSIRLGRDTMNKPHPGLLSVISFFGNVYSQFTRIMMLCN